MGILILILKIIGVLLAVLISLVAAVAEGKAVFHWLLHAVDIRLCYGHEGLAWKCRILGIPILGQQKGGQGVSGRQKERQEGAGQQDSSDDISARTGDPAD